LRFNVNKLNNFVPLASTRLSLHENEAGALKHVGVLTISRILLVYTCAFVDLDNKLTNCMVHTLESLSTSSSKFFFILHECFNNYS
jgi:hypothetical protein